MDPTHDQLRTLLAIAELGTFEAAARELTLTPSAVSQRIKAMERACGQVLVTRATPCAPTPAGEALVRLARQTRVLWDEARAALSPHERVELPVVVNADSLATWFVPVLRDVAGWSDAVLHLRVEDQARSRERLRRGEGLAAVTSDPSPVQGCTTQPLGVMRYLPVAVPELAERARAHGRLDLHGIPVVVFNSWDTLQHDQLARAGVPAPSAWHEVPSSREFHDAVRLGLGWAMLPELQAADDLAAGRLARLGRHHDDVALHWQRWSLDSPLLDRLTASVCRAAAAGLRPAAGAPRRRSGATPRE